jgi:hypothetical protein
VPSGVRALRRLLVQVHRCFSDGFVCDEEVCSLGYDDGVCRVKLKIGSYGVCPRLVPFDKRRMV